MLIFVLYVKRIIKKNKQTSYIYLGCRYVQKYESLTENNLIITFGVARLPLIPDVAFFHGKPCRNMLSDAKYLLILFIHLTIFIS
jgi:hypothetical protein